jgi:hypothetical protein
MKLSPFTLVYQPQASSSARRVAAAGSGLSQETDPARRLEDVRRSAPDLAAALESFNPHLTRTLLASSYAHEAAAPDDPVEDKLRRVVADLQREAKVVTVAIWDLDAKVGGMSQLINALNDAQSAFTCFEFQAPLPSELVIHSGDFSVWARTRLGKRVSKSEREGFANNFMFDDFQKFARVVHKQAGVDYLVGITRYTVAWTDGDKLRGNYFIASDKRVILVSAFNVREYAAQAGRPFEAAVAGMVLAAVLASLNRRLQYHEENTTGCLFDFHKERDTIVESIRQARIGPECLARIDEKYREAAVALIDMLRNYSPVSDAAPTGSGVAKKTTNKKQQDADYWLAQLAKLSSKLSKG